MQVNNQFRSKMFARYPVLYCVVNCYLCLYKAKNDYKWYRADILICFEVQRKNNV